MDVDKHAEELASALGEDKEEVKQDLQNLLEYSVPIDEAKQSVRRKYSGGGGVDATPTSMDIADITTDSGNVSVTARVLTVGTRSIRYQGDDTTIREGELADETGTISYTAWQDFGFEEGETITVGNAGVREWDGEPELNMGESSSVALESDPLEVQYVIGGERDLVDVEAGDRGLTVEARVMEVEERVIDGRDGETTILSGVLGDETARLPFTDWDPTPEVEEGAELRIEDVYVREFRGVPSINLTEFTTVSEASVEVTDEAPRVSIAEAVGSGGMYDVEVVGNVLEVRDGSGLIERCPECGRLVQNGQCRSHGQVDPEDDLRVKAILDDGTDTVTAILDRDITEAVYGGTLEDALEAAREAMSREVVAEDVRGKLVGREYRVRGHLSVDEYGANLDADEFEDSEDDPAERATAVLREVSQ
ncbi:Single-stranded DNA binding protein [Halorarum halophilum]|uniref:Single-stranded DNA binding protein n=1 Tax=Halorarum halophilum TaxID=2743090 RepID=A0A7D5K5P6_9EURY|nr:Single-stranded DNA binding protein [Halobaculum halophilum]QLG26059.1 Single-stranded DNA binding protein [Halobaculum halophilum]